MHYINEGLTVGQHDELQEKIYGLMRTKRSALLLRHRHFLTIDFVSLGRGPTLARQVWVANIEMAISVSKVARGNFCTQESLCLLCTPLAGTHQQTSSVITDQNSLVNKRLSAHQATFNFVCSKFP